MPNTRKGGNLSSKNAQKTEKISAKEVHDGRHAMDAIANVNNSRATSVEREAVSVTRQNEFAKISSPKRKYKTKKSKDRTKESEDNSQGTEDLQFSQDLEDPNNTTANFVEDGDEIQMEINDGGAATTEFESDHSIDPDESGSEVESEGSDEGLISESEYEDKGKERADSQIENDEDIDDEPQSVKRRCKDKQVKKKAEKRQSVEEQLDDLNDTLKVMKQFMMQNMNDGSSSSKSPGRGPKKLKSVVVADKRGKEINSDPSNSDTTIYKNVLQKDSSTIEQVVDKEVTFVKRNEVTEKVDKQISGDNSSSDE